MMIILWIVLAIAKANGLVIPDILFAIVSLFAVINVLAIIVTVVMAFRAIKETT